MVKDISYNVIRCDYEDCHVDYMIAVNYKSKGMLFGWNDRSFILEKDGIFAKDNIHDGLWVFVDDYESFDRAYDRQTTSSAFSYRFIRTSTIDDAYSIIDRFNTHCESAAQLKKSKTITKITRI